MDIGTIFGAVTDPVGTLTGLIGGHVLNGLILGAGGILSYQIYKIIRGVFNPAKYIGDLYGLADRVIIALDNEIIDKFIPSVAKAAIQADIKKVLLERKKAIDDLVRTIQD